MGREVVVTALLAVQASACYVVNENFQAATEGPTSTAAATGATTIEPSTAGTGATSTGTGATSTGAATGDAAATGAATSTSTSTAGSSGESAATTDGATSTSTTTGGGTPPGLYDVPAVLATCVLLDNGNGYGPPSVCSANADAQNATALTGLMMIDTGVTNLDGYGRPAHSLLRFDIPAEYASLTVAAATLHVQVADGSLADGPQSGTVVAASPFDQASLQSGPPGVGMPLASDQGYVGENQWIAWNIPPAALIAGQPLHLALLPKDGDGVFLRGAEPGAPYLELLLE